jgi:aspartyl-tRNA(Asn)/glutamyl-tRNA(Gln) amidotransferase subunit A
VTATLSTATAISTAVRASTARAVDVLEATLDRVRNGNARLNCFTRVLDDQARDDAAIIDRMVADGIDPGPLAGVPFAVKDLFDVQGLPTTAGATFRMCEAPARDDANAVARLRAAGGVLVGTLNMDEFAYGFSTENAHFGTTRNPHDTTRIAGGSSGGSAAAVAGAIVPLTLGSDTNGSIRVPASLCGTYGLRATHGKIDIGGSFPFVESLDVVGPFAATLEDLELAYALLADEKLEQGHRPLRIARLDGWFRRNADPAALDAIDRIAHAFGGAPLVELPYAEAARSAAFLITAAEGGARHLQDLRTRALAFDPATRDRLIAGALLQADDVLEAKRFRDEFHRFVDPLLEDHDVLIAPATPCVAPPIDGGTIEIDGQMVSARANLGIYTQPLSLAGVPVMSVPLKREGQLPLGLQLVAAPHREADLFAFARLLDEGGFTEAMTNRDISSPTTMTTKPC